MSRSAPKNISHKGEVHFHLSGHIPSLAHQSHSALAVEYPDQASLASKETHAMRTSFLTLTACLLASPLLLQPAFAKSATPLVIPIKTST